MRDTPYMHDKSRCSRARAGTDPHPDVAGPLRDTAGKHAVDPVAASTSAAGANAWNRRVAKRRSAAEAATKAARRDEPVGDGPLLRAPAA